MRKAIANRQVELAELGLAQFQASLAARARTKAQLALAAQQKADAAHEVAQRFRSLLDVLVQRDPAGVTPLLDQRIIEATSVTLQRRAAQAGRELQGALLELNQLRGAPAGAPLRLTGSLDVPTNAPALSVLLDVAATNSFDLRMRQAELAQQGFQVQLARNERYPKVTLAPFYASEKANDEQRIVGVGVSLPLPLWNQNQGNIEAAQAREQQAEASLRATQRDVERRVTDHALALETQLEEMAQWRPDAQAQFREAAELADRHFRLGAVPVTTYVEMQLKYLDALEALLATRHEALEHRQQLEVLVGQAARFPDRALRGSPCFTASLMLRCASAPFLLLVATVSLGIGLWSAYRLPIDAVPDITSPQVQVNTEVLALAPEETEKAVTVPLEMELSGIQGVEEMRSLTKFGLSQVTLIFRDGMDIYRARQLVAERLQAVADRLPPGLTPKLAPISTGLGEIYYYTVAWRADATNRPADRLEQLRELRELHEFTIKPMLRTTPGIAEINASGGYEKQLVIQPRPRDLEQAGLTFDDLAMVVGENVENTGGGVINSGVNQLTVRTVGRVRNVGGDRRPADQVRRRRQADPGRRRGGRGHRLPLPHRRGHRERRGNHPRHGHDAGRREQPRRRETLRRAPAGNRVAPAAGRGDPHAVRPRRPGGPHRGHREEEPVRGRHPRGGGAAADAGQLARGADRVGGDPAVVPVRAHGHGEIRRLGQPDEPGGGGFRPHH